MGYFLLSVKYPKVFGKYLVDFLEENASAEILTLVGLKKKPLVKKILETVIKTEDNSQLRET
jgi:hypothetical protein